MAIPTDLQNYIEENQSSFRNHRNNKPLKWFFIIMGICLLAGLVFVVVSRVRSLTEYNNDDYYGLYDTVSSEMNRVLLEGIYNGQEPSDITGLTKRQKADKGLCADDGSDSDFDGITDKDEIEIYGSDPLKVSTAGDLYSDKYKIDSNMDVHEYYEYNGDASFSPQEAPLFTLTAVAPVDFDSKISDCTNQIDVFRKHESYRKINYDDVYGIFIISSYTNKTFDIDLSSYYENHENEDIDVSVFLNDSINSEDVSKKIVSGVATIELPKSPDIDQQIMVVVHRKEGFFEKGIGFDRLPLLGDVISGTTRKTDSADDAYQSLIVVRFPLLNVFTGIRPEVYIANTASDEQISDTLDMAEQIYHEVYPFSITKGPLPDDHYMFTLDQCHIVDRNEIRSLTNLNDIVWGSKYICKGQMADRQIIHMYSPFDAYSAEVKAKREEIEKEHKKFIFSDRFCFNNFSTEYFSNKSHGVCAGLAWITALVHDNEGLTSLTGSYTSASGYTESYSLDENYKENDTLKDRYLYDYKIDRVNQTSNRYYFNPSNPLSKDEIEFTKMVSCYWSECNDHVTTSGTAEISVLSNVDQRWLSWNTVERMMQVIDDGRILLWGFNYDDIFSQAHCVNIFSYEKYNNGNTEIVDFSVYDNNDYSKDYVLRCIKKTKNGAESFEYDYFNEDEYNRDGTKHSHFHFSDHNEKSLYDNPSDYDIMHRFIVFDSELNVLNDLI